MTHSKLQLPLAGLHTFVGIGGVAGGLVLTVASGATPRILRLAVPRATILSGVALILIGASALIVAWTTLRADRTTKASFATTGALLIWLITQAVVVGLRSWLQIFVILVAIATLLLTAALESTETRHTEGIARPTMS